MVLLGMNYRLPDINCALGLSQMKKLDRNRRRRREIAAAYGAPAGGIARIDFAHGTDGSESGVAFVRRAGKCVPISGWSEAEVDFARCAPKTLESHVHIQSGSPSSLLSREVWV